MNVTITMDKLMSLTFAMIAAYAVALLPMDVLAFTGTVTTNFGGGGGGGGAPSAISGVLCNVVNWFSGPVGGGIATLAIIVVGIGALMGKVSWGMAIIVGLGVGVIFGAPSIVKALSPSGVTC